MVADLAYEVEELDLFGLPFGVDFVLLVPAFARTLLAFACVGSAPPSGWPGRRDSSVAEPYNQGTSFALSLIHI